MELPDPIVVLTGTLPPIAAALLLVGALGSRLHGLALAVGVFVAFWLLKAQPAWPHELWAQPDGRQWLVWALVAAGVLATLEGFRVLRGRVAAVVAALLAAGAVFFVLQKLALRWSNADVFLHVGGGGLLAVLATLAGRRSMANAPATTLPAVVWSALLSADAVLLTVARSGLLAQLCGACAAAVGAAAGTALWRRPFALGPADGGCLALAHVLFVGVGTHLADLPKPAALAAAVAPFGLLLLQPTAAKRPAWWGLGAGLWLGVPMAVAFGLALG
ncbi:MAG: hypothetical protein ACK5BN_22900 [Planctomycetota bacterium]